MASKVEKVECECKPTKRLGIDMNAPVFS